MVTGGGRGLGLACAEALAEAGAEIAILDSDEANAEHGLAALRAKGYSAQSVVLDVTDAPQVTAAAERLAGTDILVCSANTRTLPSGATTPGKTTISSCR